MRIYAWNLIRSLTGKVYDIVLFGLIFQQGVYFHEREGNIFITILAIENT